ncbi:hypothetical protein O181_124195 [Austropuccinia psidii MF-1]|uniref:Integrase catalytic domain-containing protein n=1 Tax=Austropuccinia psidii MF-1 TaxID=1389203 RepID=A0A9Q3Q4Y1_9BASI|nr:hypothetical protein [Austropuccinia psidii MF-1]
MISATFDCIPELYKAISDVKSHLSDKNTSICDNLKTNNLSLSQINDTLKCFERVLRTIKTSNNDNSFGIKINEQSAIIKELTDKYSKFNIDDIIETRIKQAINTIKEDEKKVLDDISNRFTEVKAHTIALKKCFDTSTLRTNLYQLFVTKLSFSTAYHPQTDGLSEKIIQTLEEMVRKFCAYGLEFKYCDGFTHDWCTLLTALQLAYKTSIHAITNQTPAVVEKGWNPRLPRDSLRKDLVELNPTASSFKGMLKKARKHAVRCREDSFAYAKDKWDKSHATQDFKVGDLVLALHGENNVEVELSEELSNKHPTFPVSLIKPHQSGDAEEFPLRNKVPQDIPPVESPGTKKTTKLLKERKLRSKRVRRYSDPAFEDEWLAEKDIPEATKPLKIFRHPTNNSIKN